MTAHFKLSEFIDSEIARNRGINNFPPIEVSKNLNRTMDGMERIRGILGHPIEINSGYRCEELNKVVGGSKNSQHMRGEACDFTCKGFGDPKAIAERLAADLISLGVDQLIIEGRWVHVSFTANPRHSLLIFEGGKYSTWLPTPISDAAKKT